MTSSRFVVAALVGWLFVGLLSAAPQFVPGPSARKNTCAAYDEARQVVVLYGGGVGGATYPGTWEFDGVSWTQASAVAPPGGHESHAMVYDSQRQKVVVFGGYSGGLLNDTWEFDGVSWTSVSTQHRPPARYLHAMAYDSARGRVVVFGGTTGGNNAIGDTWEYDGADWTEVTPSSGSPSARWSVHAAYDSARGKVVLFGGTSGNDETWEWDGAAWSQVSTATSAPGRSAHAMVYDNVRGKTVMWGGNGGGTGTWEYDGVDWQSVASSFPPSNRFGHGMAYDSARQEVVLFGGEAGGVLDDTWSYDGVEWRPALDYVTSPVNGNRYALTPPMGWHDAESLAVLVGGHLATIRNVREQAWLQPQFGPQSMWFGLTDEAVEGEWIWTSGEPAVYTAWGGGQPNGGTGENYGCHRVQDGLWDDDAGATLQPGIIEIVESPVAVASERFFIAEPRTQSPARIREYDEQGSLIATHDLAALVPAGFATNYGDALRVLEVTPSGTILCSTGYHPEGGWFEVDARGVMPVFYSSPGSASTAIGASGATSLVGGGIVGAQYHSGFNDSRLRRFDSSGLMIWSSVCDEALSPAVMNGQVYMGHFTNYPVTEWSLAGGAIGQFGAYRHVFTVKALPGNKLLIGDLPQDQGPVNWIIRDVATGGEVVLDTSPYGLPNTHADVDDAGNIWVLCGSELVRFDQGSTIGGTIVSLGGFQGGNGLAVSGVPAVVAVQSSAVAYGQGCGSPALLMNPQAPPLVGGVGSAAITNVPDPLGGVTIGFSDTFVAGLPFLPLSLANYGMPGCDLLHSNDIFGLPVSIGPTGTFDFSLLIPASANLLNTHVYLQAYASAPGVNAAQFIVSNGVDWLIGNQ